MEALFHDNNSWDLNENTPLKIPNYSYNIYINYWTHAYYRISLTKFNKLYLIENRSLNDLNIMSWSIFNVFPYVLLLLAYLIFLQLYYIIEGSITDAAWNYFYSEIIWNYILSSD